GRRADALAAEALLAVLIVARLTAGAAVARVRQQSVRGHAVATAADPVGQAATISARIGRLAVRPEDRLAVAGLRVAGLAGAAGHRRAGLLAPVLGLLWAEGLASRAVPVRLAGRLVVRAGHIQAVVKVRVVRLAGGILHVA